MTSPHDAAPGSDAARRRQTMDERYGSRSPNRRRSVQVATAAVALALLVWLGWAAWEHSRPDVSVRVQGYDVVSAHEVRVEVALHRRTTEAVVCDAGAQADDHAIVGERELEVPASDDHDVQVNITIRTEREATSATVSNCHIGP